MLTRHDLDPRLQGLVKTVWASDGSEASSGMERTLPTGCVHFVFRLSGGPLRIAEDESRPLITLGPDVVGGPRVGAYLRERSRAMTVGVQLHAGATMALLGVPAGELRGGHWTLEDVVGRRFASLREELFEARTAEARLACVERALAVRAGEAPMNHPAVTLALEAFRRPELPAIGALAGAAGLSHRRFITLFQRAVGMAPSEYRRIVRLQRSLDAMAGSLRSLAAVAVEHGFADQAHLTREVRALTGLTPGAYRAARPMERNHVPLTRASDSFKTAPAEAPRIPSNTKP